MHHPNVLVDRVPFNREIGSFGSFDEAIHWAIDPFRRGAPMLPTTKHFPRSLSLLRKMRLVSTSAL